MAGITARIPWNHRNIRCGFEEFKFPDQPDSSSSDMEFSFLDDGDDNNGSFDSCNSDESFGNEMVDLEGDDDDEKDNDGIDVENNNKYWENQHQLLQATLRRSSSLESRIRNAVKEALTDIQRPQITVCACGKSMADSCRICLMRKVFSHLRNVGFDIAICRSKWRSSPDIPSGKHTFLDVIENSRKGEVRVIIELKFRGEFEIARASEDYNRLVERLPEVFVGKVERLNNVVKILCLAAKKCMKEKKMHMGPWRKHRYMQAKWLRYCERNTTTCTQSLSTVGYSETVRLSKPRASMLTVDLLGTLSNVCCTEVN